MSAFKPTFLFQMLAEISEKWPEVFLVWLRPRAGIHVPIVPTHFIAIAKSIRPWNQGITVNLMVHPTLGTELHPLVKHRVIVTPSAVTLFDPFNHGLIRIISLRAPGLMDDGSG